MGNKMRDILEKYAPAVPEEHHANHQFDFVHHHGCPTCHPKYQAMPKKKKKKKARMSGQKRGQTEQDGPPRKKKTAASEGGSAQSDMKGTAKTRAGPGQKGKATDGNGKKTIFSDLLPEVVVKIFAYLSLRDLKNVALVCKEWSVLALDSRLWRGISLDGTKMPSATAAVRILQGMTQLKKLELVRWGGNDVQRILCTVWRTAPNLESLCMQHIYNLEDISLIQLPQKLSKLQEISLAGMREDGRHHLDRLAQLSHLKRLILGHSYTYLRRSGYIGSVPPLQPDTSLERKWGNLVEVCIFRNSSDIELVAVIDSIGKQLRKLAVGFLKEKASFIHLSNCQLLNELHLTNAKAMNDQGLLNGVGSLLNLKHLTLRWLTSNMRYGFQQFMACPQVVENLESLDLSFSCCLTDEGLSLIAANCPRLKCVSFGGCSNITEQGLKCLVTCCPELVLVNLHKSQIQYPSALTSLSPHLHVNLT